MDAHLVGYLECAGARHRYGLPARCSSGRLRDQGRVIFRVLHMRRYLLSSLTYGSGALLARWRLQGCVSACFFPHGQPPPLLDGNWRWQLLTGVAEREVTFRVFPADATGCCIVCSSSFFCCVKSAEPSASRRHSAAIHERASARRRTKRRLACYRAPICSDAGTVLAVGGACCWKGNAVTACQSLIMCVRQDCSAK